MIAGEWRGRRIRFPTSAELRPTPDRVRETLFNWLQGVIAGSRCLDLFAGSGALGIESLSRGARDVHFIERDPAAAAAIRSTLAEFKSERGTVHERDAPAWLAGRPEAFDIVFLDPPFAQGGLEDLCRLLETRGWLAPGAFIYLEHAAQEPDPTLPAGWELWREMRAGEVHGLLARRQLP